MNRQLALLAALAMLAALATCQKDKTKPGPTAEDLPGATLTDELRDKLAAALAARGSDYVPRTRHKQGKAPRYTNRLILEASPYLLQHAHNPVNWYAWGDEAFEAAARLGRPVFLSIGYSTCHWCHVMEEESFEDPEIARYLNENYIAIKVDREERPDVDAIYMSAVQAMGQGGGWPLNVWLTPKRKPFFGGTYFPPRAGVRGARVGFREILERARDEFATNREAVAQSADRVAAAIAKANRPAPGDELPGASVLVTAAAYYRGQFDQVDGGIRPSPRNRTKFPSAFANRALLRIARRTGDTALADMVGVTLTRMAGGGIYDQLGGGFHRYSTDPRWLVPHFEKMLYDNAQLVVVYLEAWQALGDPRFARVATDILAYVKREMTSPGGGFYSATDADSMTASGEREEGAFFVWTRAEIERALPKSGDQDAAPLALAYWGVTDGGNWEGKSILTSHAPLAAIAKKLGIDPAAARAQLDRATETLMAVRAKRSPPLRDEKILAAWNGLMISGFARAALVLGGDRHPAPEARGAGLDHLAIATRAAEMLDQHMTRDGRLSRAYKDGRAYNTGFAEDYAFVIAGYLDLFEASGEPRWLSRALALQSSLDRHYRAPGGAYYQTADDAEVLLAREIPDRDGAVPSANSVAALNLLRLYELTSDPAHLASADRVLKALVRTLQANPAVMSEMLLAIDWRTDVAKEIVLVAAADRAALAPLEAVLAPAFTPNAVVVRAVQGDAALAKAVPLTAGKVALRGAPTAYVCEQSRCELPTSKPEVLRKQLNKVSPIDKRPTP